MKKTIHSLILFTTLTLVAFEANAKCQRMGFLVNDYGKDGPSKDAKNLLDKHVAKWASENKIKKYTVGKKEVSCELFLNFIVFDEHTCTASANVCWDEAMAAAKPKSSPLASKAEETKKTLPSGKTTEGSESVAKKDDSNESNVPAEQSNTNDSTIKSPDGNKDASHTEINAKPTDLTSQQPSGLPLAKAQSSDSKGPIETPSTDKVPSITGTTSSSPGDETSNSERKGASTSDETSVGTNCKTTETKPSQELNNKQKVVRIIETTTEPTTSSTPLKGKTSEPAKTKSKTSLSKKPSSASSKTTGSSEEASNTEGAEVAPSDIETGSLPFFAIGKDTQPEYSRNPLNQNIPLNQNSEASQNSDVKLTETSPEEDTMIPVSKVKPSETTKNKVKSQTSKKPVPSASKSKEPAVDSPTTEVEEPTPAEVETGSLPFFSTQKDNQPEFSRNPLSQPF